MADQLHVLAHVAAALDAAGIPFMVTGSIAAGYYGQPRMTRDVNLVVDLGPDDPSRLERLFAGEYMFSAETVREAIRHESMYNAIHQEALVKVDFVIRKSTPFRLEEFSRRRRVEFDGHPMWIVTAEDLVLSKLVWRQDSESEIQMRDVRAIIAVQGDRLDWSYLERWAAVLGVAEALERTRA